MNKKKSTHHDNANSTSVYGPSSLPFATTDPYAAQTSHYQLDARTRAIGLAGVAKARATLAACQPQDEELPEDGSTEGVEVPLDGDVGDGSNLDALLCEAA